MELQWPLILFTFFLCLAGGAAIIQGVLTLMGKGKDLQKIMLIVAAASTVIGGIAVFFHLQHWERIFNAFSALLVGNGMAISGITFELWGCVIILLAVLLYFLFMNRSEEGVAPKWCAVLLVIAGVALPTLTGTSYLMNSIPSWNTPLLPVYYLLNAVLFGGLIALVAAAKVGDTEVSGLSANISMGSAVALLVVLLAYAGIITSFGQFGDIQYYFDPVHPDTAMANSAGVNASIMAGSLAPMYWGLAIAVGLVIPAVLAFMARKAEGSKTLTLGACALVCAIVGSFAWRAILYIVAISIFAMY